jgi:L-alanine-DL-glutamate epimerase-like enolase superfamily enzyme
MAHLSRKIFLKRLSLGVAGLAIADFGKATPTLFSGVSANKFAATGAVKITDVVTYVHPKATFIKIETDAGISGWGEGDHDHVKLVAETIRSVAKPILVGQDPFNSEYFWHQILFQGEDLGTAGLLTGALAGVDNALWDLKGKITNQPVYKLLGGNNVEKIKVYGSFARGEGKDIKNAEQTAKSGVKFVEQGYDTIKLRMQIRTLNLNPEPDPTEEYVKTLRQMVGDKITIFVDFNNGYTAGKAIPLIKKLYEKYNIALVEEPVSYLDYRGLRQVVDASDIRIAAGEHEFNRWQFRQLITEGSPDVLNCDTIKGGGITEMRKAAILGQAFEKEVMCHSTRPTLGCAAMLHFVASLTNAARVQEHGGDRAKEMKLAELFNNQIRYEAGHLYVPQTAGLGLEINEKQMEKYRTEY